jgi:MYXO-CTERM domain-containing protein
MTLRRYPGRGAPCAAALWLGAALTVSTGAAAAVGAGGSGASSAPDEDIRDIRALRSDTPEWVMPAVIAGAVLLALAAYGLGRRRRRRAAPALSPLQLAERRLEELRTRMTPADSVRFAVEISAVVREYSEQRFNVGATQLTSEEFLRKVRESSDAALARQGPALAEFLGQCDIVKFAGARLTADAMESLHRRALAFVREAAHSEDARDPLPAT